MTLIEAMDLLSPAIDPDDHAWMDLGAGSGTFTEALANITPKMYHLLIVNTPG